nr:hypothetical protein CFP56_12291 [Quercus suber]
MPWCCGGRGSQLQVRRAVVPSTSSSRDKDNRWDRSAPDLTRRDREVASGSRVNLDALLRQAVRQLMKSRSGLPPKVPRRILMLPPHDRKVTRLTQHGGHDQEQSRCRAKG